MNDKLYIRESVSGVVTDYKISLTAGSYTPQSLSQELSLQLNTLPGTYTVSVASTGNKLIITNSYVFPTSHAEILTREQLVNRSISPAWSGTGVHSLNYDDSQSAHSVIGVMSGSGGVYAGQMLLGQFVSLMPYRQLYVHSHLAVANSLGARGESSIVKKVIIANSPGDIVTDVMNTTADSLEMPAVLNSLHISLRDVNGKVVNLQGHPLSLTLLIPDN